MPRLTDEEYAALGEKWTRETPVVNFSRPGMFARQRLRPVDRQHIPASERWQSPFPNSLIPSLHLSMSKFHHKGQGWSCELF